LSTGSLKTDIREQVGAVAAALCRLVYQRVRAIRGANIDKRAMSPPLKAQFRGIKWNPRKVDECYVEGVVGDLQPNRCT
jgi:hypothetical protein